MASRSEIFSRLERALLDAGIVTVYRGIFIPSEAALPETSYPVAAYYEDSIENIDDYEYGSRCHQEASLDIWMNVGELGPYDETRKVALAQLDDLHDAVVRKINVMFINYASQTLVYKLTSFQPYWFMGNEPAIGGGFKLKTSYTIAPAASDIPA